MKSKVFVLVSVWAVSTWGAVSLPLADEVAREKAEAVLSRLTLDQKVGLLGGSSTMYLEAFPEAGVPRAWAFSDSTHMIKPEHNAWDWTFDETRDNRSTVMPAGSALAMTWNTELAALHGEVMGEQMRARGKDQMLGPGVNINRLSLCGRNWEYMSEDPYLAGKLAASMIRAVQAQGVAATVKHFCLNNQEQNRMYTDAVVDERTFHEIYLPAFEMAIREGGALAVMTSYNQVNGTYASENAWIQRGILRERLGFKGLVVSDWGGQHSTVPAALNGAGIEMHFGQGIRYFNNPKAMTRPLADAVRANEVPEATVDDMARHVLFVMAKTGFLDGLQPAGEILTPKHFAAAQTIAEESITLLKNEKGVLPLEKSAMKKVVVLGVQSDLKFAHLGASCEARTDRETTCFQGLVNYLGDQAEVKLYPLGAEGVSNGQPAEIPNGVLATYKKDTDGAFAQRAWEMYGWTDDQHVWADKPVLLGYADYPTGFERAALRYVAQIIPTETGVHRFLIAEGAKIGGASILVNGERVFNVAKGRPTVGNVMLEKGVACTVTVDIAKCSGADAFTLGWQTPTMLLAGAGEKDAALDAADAVIVFTGTHIGNGRARESESGDMPSAAEPAGHDDEIAALLKRNLKRLVIVNRSGTPMEMPWADDCATLVQMSYLGQEGGTAFARVLFGEVNPSGKLAASFFRRYADTAVATEGTYTAARSLYREQFYVGYRWYDKKEIAPLFPFGHGLSYTTFAYNRFTLSELNNRWHVTVDVANTGTVAGKEVAQIYVKSVDSSVARCVKDLRGFAKTGLLAPQARETLSFSLSPRDFAYYDTLYHRWRAPKGKYEILVGASSHDIRASLEVNLKEDIILND